MPNRKQISIILSLLILLLAPGRTSLTTLGPPRITLAAFQAASAPAAPLYETRPEHDPNGTGKFYMGRELAQVMGPGGIPSLDRPERQTAENPPQFITAIQPRPTHVLPSF